MISPEAIAGVLKKASIAVLDVYRSENYPVQSKADKSPVTLADRLSNEIIIDGLSVLTPDIPVISEETLHLPYTVRKEYRQVWILDPLDGTREFVSRNDEFCICLALVKEGRPVAGFIFAPVTGDLWYAFTGKGAFHEKDGITIPLPLQRPPSTPVVLISRSHHNRAEKEWIDKYVSGNGGSVLAVGSALKFCRLAEGRATVYPKFGPINEWDVAAGDIILSEAGGEIIETASGQRPVYNKESLIQPHFIAKSNKISDI